MKLTANLDNLFRKKTAESPRLGKFIIILVMTFQLTGCGSLPDSLPANTVDNTKVNVYNAELEQNREVWQGSKISNYNFVISKMDMGTWSWMPFLIKVRDGQAVSKTPENKLRPMTIVDGYDDFDTVEKIFNQIQEAYNKGYAVEVRYNKKFGYPEKTVIDHMKSTDSSFSIGISKFEIIKTE